MRIRTCLSLLACCCCAGVTACAAGPPGGPATAVSTPAVGRPQPPASAQAALSDEAFTPYAALGQSSDDGLAPGESEFGLAQACLNAAGYPAVGTGNVPFNITLGPANLSFAQPWGGWGYLGAAEAQEYGFNVPPGSALTALGIGLPSPAASPPTPSAAEQTAIGKCGTIVQNFTDAAQKGPLAGIQALSNDIADDVAHDAAVKSATRAWITCMAGNGYSFPQPQNVFFTELNAMYGGSHEISPGETVSAAANQAQIAVAVTDATCTQSAGLAGIYFAVQASYEQQLVNANQQALATAVQQYRRAYARELNGLPSLLRAARAEPVPSGRSSP
jgi:hypothetical protein